MPPNKDAGEYLAMLGRIVEIAGYLDVSERVEYTKYDVQKMMTHILKGGGYL